MNRDKEIVRAVQGLQRRHGASGALTVCGEQLIDTLLKQIHITRLNAKGEPDQWLDDEFVRVFAGEPVAAVEWAFQQWRDQTHFYPAISDIRDLVKRWKETWRIDEEAARHREDVADMEKARTAGFLMSAADQAEIQASIERAKDKMACAGMHQRDMKLTPAELDRARGVRPLLYVTPEDWRRRADAVKAQLRGAFPEKFESAGGA